MGFAPSEAICEPTMRKVENSPVGICALINVRPPNAEDGWYIIFELAQPARSVDRSICDRTRPNWEIVPEVQIPPPLLEPPRQPNRLRTPLLSETLRRIRDAAPSKCDHSGL